MLVADGSPYGEYQGDFAKLTHGRALFCVLWVALAMTSTMAISRHLRETSTLLRIAALSMRRISCNNRAYWSGWLFRAVASGSRSPRQRRATNHDFPIGNRIFQLQIVIFFAPAALKCHTRTPSAPKNEGRLRRPYFFRNPVFFSLWRRPPPRDFLDPSVSGFIKF